jgi:DNA repair exonuclease SbcCD ATPase subunit
MTSTARPATTEQLPALVDRLRRIRRQLDRATGEARAIALAGQRATTEVTQLRAQIQLHEQAAALLASIGETRQATAQTQIETLVTQGLRTIFDTTLSFHLVPAVRAKTPVVDFIVRSKLADTVVDTDVMDARGGGLAATVGFLLRLVILLLKTPREAVLLLDETFAHVSAEYEPRLAEFLRELVDRTGVQIIMVTHSDAFLDCADVRYRFELRDGVTTVKPV